MQYTKMYVQKRGGGGGVITCLLNMLYRKGPNYFLGVNFFFEWGTEKNEVQRKIQHIIIIIIDSNILHNNRRYSTYYVIHVMDNISQINK